MTQARAARDSPLTDQSLTITINLPPCTPNLYNSGNSTLYCDIFQHSHTLSDYFVVQVELLLTLIVVLVIIPCLYQSVCYLSVNELSFLNQHLLYIIIQQKPQGRRRPPTPQEVGLKLGAYESRRDELNKQLKKEYNEHLQQVPAPVSNVLLRHT